MLYTSQTLKVYTQFTVAIMKINPTIVNMEYCYVVIAVVSKKFWSAWFRISVLMYLCSQLYILLSIFCKIN